MTECQSVSSLHFNSHAHVERDCSDMILVRGDSDFNSHAHVERDHIDEIVVPTIDISTHTLTWSVTC